MIKQSINTYKSTLLLHNLFWGVLISLLFSSFIYLEHFGHTFKLLNTLSALSALALLLYATKRTILISGFFIGLLWFYWIGYSFEYQGVGFMTPVITVSFGFIYLLFFGILALSNKIYIRALLLFGLSFVEPFDWNWMQIELLFVESYIGVSKYQLALVLAGLSLPYYIKKPFTYLPLVLIVLAYNYNPPEQEESQLKIKLVQTDIKQEDKWLSKTLKPTLQTISREIHSAIDKKYDIVVLPESVFPLFMNRNKIILKKVLELSHDIAIVAGSLIHEKGNSYNVTYIMQDGKYVIAKKLILVPFGEYIPLPKFAQKIINDTFFSGQSDFTSANRPTDFTIKGEVFRNAICYEATCQEIYEGDVKFVIATSNNAWFSPSIEPTLQNLLMRYYARKNGVIIYHSANYKGTGIVK
ncbi:MAG: apolipoprotein N-acyltransferase [Sulfurimonas sp.]|jgi:apolipoprotein N-acyltransferase|uniref:apolipoprotein N-acyltransferase n=1 Tax=Sulfurimonas sp. TaxID=2022749 RepID=UPI0039E71DE2